MQKGLKLRFLESQTLKKKIEESGDPRSKGPEFGGGNSGGKGGEFTIRSALGTLPSFLSHVGDELSGSPWVTGS